tara:strand:+ start:832 stop:1881 length:1050 start_codon:yes stop_codon:yes gene_type:complete
MNDLKLTIIFDNAPSSHKEGFIERISLDSDILLFHLASFSDTLHPSRAFLRNISFPNERYIFDPNSNNQDIKNKILKIFLKYQSNNIYFSSIQIIYSFIDIRRLLLVNYVKKISGNISKDIKLIPYLEPIRLNDFAVSLRIVKISASLLLQKLFFKTEKIYLISSLNSFFYKLFFKYFEIIPYQQTKEYINKCRNYKNFDTTSNFNILFIGQLVDRKNPLLLLKACKRVNFRINLTIVGIGPLKEKLLDEIKNSKTNGLKIKFIETIDNNNIYEVIKKNHVLVLPSKFDGFGFVVAEAIYCQTYVIVSSNVGAKDLILNGSIGSIFKNNSMEELINHLNLHYLRSFDFV